MWVPIPSKKGRKRPNNKGKVCPPNKVVGSAIVVRYNYKRRVSHHNVNHIIINSNAFKTINHVYSGYGAMRTVIKIFGVGFRALVSWIRYYSYNGSDTRCGAVSCVAVCCGTVRCYRMAARCITPALNVTNEWKNTRLCSEEAVNITKAVLIYKPTCRKRVGMYYSHSWLFLSVVSAPCLPLGTYYITTVIIMIVVVELYWKPFSVTSYIAFHKQTRNGNYSYSTSWGSQLCSRTYPGQIVARLLLHTVYCFHHQTSELADRKRWFTVDHCFFQQVPHTNLSLNQCKMTRKEQVNKQVSYLNPDIRS